MEVGFNRENMVRFVGFLGFILSFLGGGALGVGQGGVSQPSNLIRLITNTLKDVSTAQQGGGGNGNGAAVFTNILQQLLVLVKAHFF